MRAIVTLSLTTALVACSSGCSSTSTGSPATDASSDGTGDGTGDGTTEAAADVRDDAPVDTATPDGDAACTLTKPYSSKDPACNKCAQEHCCAQVNACLGDPRCDDDYVNCILACALLPADAGDAGAELAKCLSDCATAHPEGKLLYDAAIGCVDAACKGTCK